MELQNYAITLLYLCQLPNYLLILTLFTFPLFPFSLSHAEIYATSLWPTVFPCCPTGPRNCDEGAQHKDVTPYSLRHIRYTSINTTAWQRCAGLASLFPQKSQ